MRSEIERRKLRDGTSTLFEGLVRQWVKRDTVIGGALSYGVCDSAPLS
jgi:hypothetical protein